MNDTSEWQKVYHPKFGKYVYKHKGTGVLVDSLFKIGKVLKKPLVSLAKKAGKQVAEKGIAKASGVVVKKAGDKIANVLRRRQNKGTARPTRVSERRPPTAPARVQGRKSNQNKETYHQNLIKLNNLISQL